MSFDPGNRLIAAIDTPGRADAEQLIEQLGGVPSWIKLGLELFCAEGPSAVAHHVARGRRVMLDLKLHDIPETVGRATARVAALGAELLTVHASGGRAMLEAAVRAAGVLRVLAVTVLTSLDDADLALIGAQGPVRELVVRRAQLAIEAGCAGVVTSPREAAAVRAIAPPGFLIVTPGVRPAEATTGDQKRVMTPREARAAGADLIVVGRPLRDAKDPAAAARAIAAELAESA
ncbi:MAG TPA: orotidine-5'-phosphate decarboxylase [Kofleriaceae bacterium]|jgi:orotidine-5'-phosphate decarboxylase|nr:orotidine-5'-phosphate decarboxylase [Kofleriaceae bacterium]